MEMALSDFGDGMHAWSPYLKEANIDQDILEIQHWFQIWIQNIDHK